MKKPGRKKNMYETQLDYIKVLIDMEKFEDAVEKLNHIKNNISKKIENKQQKGIDAEKEIIRILNEELEKAQTKY